MIVKGRMGRSNESPAVSKERDLQIMILLYAKASGDHAAVSAVCSGHDQSKTLVGKELNFSKPY